MFLVTSEVCNVWSADDSQSSLDVIKRRQKFDKARWARRHVKRRTVTILFCSPDAKYGKMTRVGCLDSNFASHDKNEPSSIFPLPLREQTYDHFGRCDQLTSDAEQRLSVLSHPSPAADALRRMCPPYIAIRMLLLFPLTRTSFFAIAKKMWFFTSLTY